jgi:hypothetical protein
MPAARARRAGAATRGQSICFVLSLLGVGGSCRAESFGGGGGLIVEDRSSGAKRINHLESFRLKISRCPVQLTVNYVLFVCTYTESTDRVFLRYRYGNYREIPTEYRPKIPNRYTTLDTTHTYFSFRKTLDLGGKGGKSSGATKMCSLRTEKLSRNWQSRKMDWCLVKVPTVGKKLSRNWRRGDDCLYSMVPFRFSFSPMRGI